MCRKDSCFKIWLSLTVPLTPVSNCARLCHQLCVFMTHFMYSGAHTDVRGQSMSMINTNTNRYTLCLGRGTRVAEDTQPKPGGFSRDLAMPQRSCLLRCAQRSLTHRRDIQRIRVVVRVRRAAAFRITTVL